MPRNETALTTVLVEPRETASASASAGGEVLGYLPARPVSSQEAPRSAAVSAPVELPAAAAGAGGDGALDLNKRASVVAAREFTSPTVFVEAKEALATTAATPHSGIRLTGQSPVALVDAMLKAMLGDRQDLEILRRVVRPVAIQVMDVLALLQWSANLLRRDHPMLVGVPPDIGQRMFSSHSQEDVPVRCDRASSAPIPISGASGFPIGQSSPLPFAMPAGGQPSIVVIKCQRAREKSTGQWS